MKKVIAVLLGFISFAAEGQKMEAAQVPAVVRAGFTQNFPVVRDARWEQERGDYEVNFQQGGKHMSALFDVSGKWKETETDIPVANLPAAAHKYLLEHYRNKKIKEAAELKLADGSTNYEAEVNGTDVIFDATGHFLTTKKD